MLFRSVVRCLLAAEDRDAGEAAADAARRAWEIACQSEDPILIGIAAHTALRANYRRGDLVAADTVLPKLSEAARLGALPFGVVRAALGATTNAIARGDLGQASTLFEAEQALTSRVRTLGGASAVQFHRFLLARETDCSAEVLSVGRTEAADRNSPNVWDAVLALAELGRAHV